MIKVSVFYPAGEGSTFDMDYYCNSHMPMVASECGGALRGMSVDAGLAGGAPGQPAPYSALPATPTPVTVCRAARPRTRVLPRLTVKPSSAAISVTDRASRIAERRRSSPPEKVRSSA